MKTHDTQKPYQCSVCNRGYNTAAALTAHMQNHKAKLTAHALSQLLKEVHTPTSPNTFTQILKDSQSDQITNQGLSQILKENTSQKSDPAILNQLLRESVSFSFQNV